MKYKIAIEEHLSKEFEIEADSCEEAINKSIDMYQSEKIAVGSENLTAKMISCIEPENTEWEMF